MNVIRELSRRDHTDLIFRSDNMSLMNEALARAHCHSVREEFAQQRLARRLLAARRLERRAKRAAARARRLAAAATVASSRV